MKVENICVVDVNELIGNSDANVDDALIAECLDDWFHDMDGPMYLDWLQAVLPDMMYDVEDGRGWLTTFLDRVNQAIALGATEVRFTC
jgi:hypothetical protein